MPASTAHLAGTVTPTVAGKPDVLNILDLMELAHEYRMHRIVFEAARDVFDQNRSTTRTA